MDIKDIRQHIKNPTPIDAETYYALLRETDRPLLVTRDRAKIGRLLMALSSREQGIQVKYDPDKKVFILFLPLRLEHYASFLQNGFDRFFIEGHIQAWREDWITMSRTVSALCLALDISWA